MNPTPGTLISAADAGRAPVSEVVALWRFFRRYRNGILLITLAASLIGLLVAISLPPIYQSTVTLLIEPKSQQVVDVQEVYDPTQGATSEYYATQYELLRSR
ncbi:MAG: hypothetical protein EPN60_04915, partial [Nevskiaceae bacterium]